MNPDRSMGLLILLALAVAAGVLFYEMTWDERAMGPGRQGAMRIIEDRANQNPEPAPPIQFR